MSENLIQKVIDSLVVIESDVDVIISKEEVTEEEKGKLIDYLKLLHSSLAKMEQGNESILQVTALAEKIREFLIADRDKLVSSPEKVIEEKLNSLGL